MGRKPRMPPACPGDRYVWSYLARPARQDAPGSSGGVSRSPLGTRVAPAWNLTIPRAGRGDSASGRVADVAASVSHPRASRGHCFPQADSLSSLSGERGRGGEARPKRPAWSPRSTGGPPQAFALPPSCELHPVHIRGRLQPPPSFRQGHRLGLQPLQVRRGLTPLRSAKSAVPRLER